MQSETGVTDKTIMRQTQIKKQKKLPAYTHVMIARDRNRPKIMDFINELFDDFLELSGDRMGKEDRSVTGGIGLLDGIPVTVVGHRKGRTLEENVANNFGMPGPEGFRKSLRLMKQAEKFGRPVITLIDTPGAYPGKEAEENGISAAIAENMAQMSDLAVPVIAVVTGEGSSGGALALGVADRVWMLEYAVYSILSPEGFASILWKDADRSREACEVMRMTAAELYEDGLIDRVIPEAAGGIQNAFTEGCSVLKRALAEEIRTLSQIPAEELVEQRYRKFRRIEGGRRPVYLSVR
ncbi:MAG: acetyl-CoA carboxylase carboxyltransferase subunit alpha [Eubacterium sp.]|nr:acetyl-CoA carboxylase carboxyltransferase subunit alpha [Eubacterium sp.]